MPASLHRKPANRCAASSAMAGVASTETSPGRIGVTQAFGAAFNLAWTQADKWQSRTPDGAYGAGCSAWFA